MSYCKRKRIYSDNTASKKKKKKFKLINNSLSLKDILENTLSNFPISILDIINNYAYEFNGNCEYSYQIDNHIRDIKALSNNKLAIIYFSGEVLGGVWN